MVARTGPELAQAVDVIMELSEEERTRMLAESREKYRRDAASRRDGAMSLNQHLAAALAALLALGPAALRAQDGAAELDPALIFLEAGQQPGGEADDPFSPPPAGSVPLGSAAPPAAASPGAAPPAPAGGVALGSEPAASARPSPDARAAAEDDPFGASPPARPAAQAAGEGAPLPSPPESALAVAPLPPNQAAPASPPLAPDEAQAKAEAQAASLRALFPEFQPSRPGTPSAPPPPPAEKTSPPAVSFPPPPEPAAAEPAAISQAGDLLSREYYGQAKILPPLNLNRPALAALEGEAAEEAPPAAKAAPPPTATPPAAKTPTDKAPAAAKAPKTAAPKAPPARGPLTLVNETGDPQAGLIYGSVLGRLGYSVSTRPPGGDGAARPAGWTFIYYRPGDLARAKALARNLPGRKTLAEAPGAGDIVVILR